MRGVLSLVSGAALALTLPLRAQSPLDDGRTALRAGEYQKAVELATAAIPDALSDNAVRWQQIRLEALLAQGKYAEALTLATELLEAEQAPTSLTLLWTIREAFLSGGRRELAAEIPGRIVDLMSRRSWAYRDAANVVIYGRAELLRGAEPKAVLDKVYAVAAKLEPGAREPLLARADLALDKNEGALAAKTCQEALDRFPDDPDFLYRLARAFSGSDREEMGKALDGVFAARPDYVPALLLRADLQIDREDYGGAAATLDEVAVVNPHHPEMHALRAVLAHLRHDTAAEQAARAAALEFWPDNPLVDHVIGRKLSQKYRFAEGAAAQRRALAFDSGYLPAQAQLASDLLRLGTEEEGWKLAEEVGEKNAYDVSVYNLLTLHDAMEASFTTRKTEHFTVRMEAGEAAVYGDRVLSLLERARTVLGPKYGVEVTSPTIVEIFPKQKDFGVRTFGMPENPGYLGVCFGRVVTANSPAANKGHPVNWEAVLWHEFCHTVTLQATANRMPRWLSEGISVHEERQADPSWGEHMEEAYREFILGGELTPVSQLSGAFLSPASALHLQFAYYEASLVIDFILERAGAEALRSILTDLRDGVFINDTLARRVMPMEEFEAAFATWVKELAEGQAPGLNRDEPGTELLLPGAEADFDAWAATRPDNRTVLLRRATRLMEDKNWQEAAVPLRRLVELHPDQTGPGSPWLLLANVLRELGDAAGEQAALVSLTARDAAAPEATARLGALAAAAGDWPLAIRQAERALAVNPLVPAPWRALAEAAEKSGDRTLALSAWRALLALDPPNPAAVNWQLARLLHAEKSPDARRFLLLTLEDAPRHREALKLLLEMQSAARP